MTAEASHVGPRQAMRPRVAGVCALLAAVAIALIAAAPSANAAKLPWAKRYSGYLTAPDGATLHYSVLLPKNHGRFPVIMNYSGYDPGSIGGKAYQAGYTAMWPKLDAALLEAGYAVVGVNIPGTGCSGGPLHFFDSSWGTDGAAAVEWAGTQPWSTGSVGMDNWSFAGLSQIFVAEQDPLHLRAIAPGMVVADPSRDVGYPGGVQNTLFPEAWWLYIRTMWKFAAASAKAEHDTQCLENIARHEAEGEHENPVTLGEEEPFVTERNVETWRSASKINVPVFSVEDWQDEATGVRGGFYQSQLDPAKTWYLGTNGRHDIYVSSRLRELLIAYFNHFVKGEKNGFEKGPHAWLWQDTSAPGAPLSNDEQLEEARPGWVTTFKHLPIRVTPVTLSLRSQGRLTHAPATEGEGADSFAYPNPGPAVNADLSTGEAQWQSNLPAPGSTPVYTTPALAKDYTTFGPASANLWVSTTTPDADVQVTLTEVRPDGSELYVQRGWLRLSQRAVDAELSSPLSPFHPQTAESVQYMQPGVPALARVELEKFSHTFRAGSSIRIWIDTPSETGEWAFRTLTTPGTVSILHDAAHPSGLVLGLLGSKPAPVAAAACNALVGEPCRTSTVPVPAGKEALR